MKKIFIGLGGLVAALLAAVLIVPGLIDWNEAFKAEITSFVKDATGRDVFIDGNIELTVLPAPALNIANVRLANIDGAQAPDMVRLKSLQVRVALGPLLGGRIQVQNIRLLEPVIELERLADGRFNGIFKGAAKQTPPGLETDGDGTADVAGSGKDSTGSEPDIVLDSFVIENATVVYRDSKAGTVERIDNINANIAAASISGPFESTGVFSLRGIAVNYDATVGKIIEARTAPVNLTLDIAPGATRAKLSGIVVGIDGDPKFKGKIALSGEQLSGLIQGVIASGQLPGLLGQEFDVSADVTTEFTKVIGAELGNLSVGLGAVTATGDATIELGKAVNINLNLATDSIDADKLLALPVVAMPVASPAASPATAAAKTSAIAVAVAPSMPAGNLVSDAGFALPGGVNANLRLSAKSISLNGGLVRSARLDAQLANGEITISQLSAQLPGNADVAAFGFVVPHEGKPQFDGELEISVDNVRGILGWLDISTPPVATDRLRKLTLTSMVTATSDEARLDKIDLQFDSSRLTGSVSAALKGTKAVSADLVLDRINLDAYTGSAKASKSGTAGTAPSPISASIASASNKTGQTQASEGPLAALSALKSLDARLKARIKTLVYKGAPIKEIVVDGKIANNTMTLNSLSVAKMAGAKIKASGVVSSLVGVPALKNVSLDVSTGDVARLLRMAGVQAPVDSRKMGAVSLRVMANGSLLRPHIDAAVKGAGGSLQAKGKVSLLPVFDGFDGTMSLKHKNAAALIRALGVKYRPAGKLGSVDFSTAIKARASGLRLSDIKARIGPVNATGTANVALDGPRVKLTAALKSGEIVVDNFLPASGKAALSRGAGVVPAAFSGRPARPADPVFRRFAALSSGRWSTKPLDFSVLKSFDADLKLRADAISYGKYRISGADLAAVVNGGVLHVERFNGGLFGGSIAANGNVTAANPSRFTAALSLQGLSVASALAAVTGKSLAKGNGALELRMSSAGYTLSDMIAGLSGNGSIALNKLDVKSGGAGTPMAAAFGLINGLNDLGGLLSGRKSKSSLADITGNFTIDRGVARFRDLALNSGMGTGRAGGSADLARWLVDVNGEVVLSQGFLGQLLNGGKQSTQRLPFRISGRLDSPNVKLDTSLLQAAGLPIPGLDKVLKKNKVGRLLQQIIPGLGGTSSQPSQPSRQSPPPAPGDTPPPPPQQQQQQQQQKVKPEDLIKGLFRGFGR